MVLKTTCRPPCAGTVAKAMVSMPCFTCPAPVVDEG
jgi:hypothetical protein